ncbi:MAG: efflux RND transporter permease subunit [Xanthomonadales bacterium]|nr:efflux RND transporter permease subunit [Xanthomonadales bacterium]
MNIARLALQRPVTTVMFFVSLVVIGLIAARDLPLEFFPELDAPFIAVNVPYAGSTPKEVEREITRPLEEVLGTLPGIKQMQSESKADGAGVFMIFEWGVDLAIKAAEVRERVDAARDELPSDVRRINVFKFNTADEPILRVRLSAGDMDLRGQYHKLERLLKRPLERIAGIARVDLSGVAPDEVQIALLPERIASHSIDLNRLSRLLMGENFSLSGGLIDDGNTRVRVQPEGEFRSLEQIGALIVNDAGVRLRDIAEIRHQPQQMNYRRILDGEYAVGVDIYKERGANLVETGRLVREEVERINASGDLGDIRMITFDDKAEGVTGSLSELLKSGLLGMALSLFVLFAFLRHWPSTLMVSLAVPICATITLGFMYFMGLTLNILSMMGLLLAVGMLVDNAVVVVESIFQERERGISDPKVAAINGAQSVTLAVSAGTLTSVIVFVPIIFGEKIDITIFLVHVAIPLTVALLCSWLVAISLIPMLAARVNPPAGDQRVHLFDHIRGAYERFLTWTLAHRWKTSLGIVVLLLLTAIPAKLVNFDMFPADDRRSIRVEYDLNGSYRLEELEPAVRKVMDYLEAHREEWQIKSLYSWFSEDGGMSTWVNLRDDADASLTATEVSEKIRENLPQVAIGKVSVGSGRNDGDGNAGVRLSVVGDSTAILEDVAGTLVKVLQTVPGLSDVRVDQGTAEREVQLKVDRDRAVAMGFDTQQISQLVSVAMRGQPLNEYRGEEGEVALWLRFKDADQLSLDQLGQIQLTRPGQPSVPLTALVSLDVEQGPATIQRTNRQVALQIQSDLDKDVSMGDARERIEAALKEVQLPAGYSWNFGRGFDRDQEASNTMLFNFLLAIALIYMVMAALFESTLYPLTILTSIVFSICGVFWAFMFTGTTFSLTAMIGILILIGVVVNNGIVLIEHVNNLRREGKPRDVALALGGRERLRPILMTVGTTVLGLLPLCISNVQIGGDGPPYYPMARAIAGGLLFSTLVSLVVLPTIYALVDDFTDWLSRLFRRAGTQARGFRNPGAMAIDS